MKTRFIISSKYPSTDIIKVIQGRRTDLQKMQRNAYKIFFGKPEGKRAIGIIRQIRKIISMLS